MTGSMHVQQQEADKQAAQEKQQGKEQRMADRWTVERIEGGSAEGGGAVERMRRQRTAAGSVQGRRVGLR